MLSDTLVKATPLILTGLACALAFRMRLWNIGAEGQFLLGAWGASAVVLVPILPAGHAGHRGHPGDDARRARWPAALWGFIPGILKARFGVNEIITTLMLNYIALSWIQFWVFGPWSEGGFQQTEPFPPRGLAAAPDRLRRGRSRSSAASPSTSASSSGSSRPRSCGSSLERTRWGYEIRLIGDNPRAARYAGIDIARMILVVLRHPGALAGLAG